MSGTKWNPANCDRIWAEPNDQGRTIDQAITSARHSVDIAIYEIGGPQITAALCRAKANGVAIRILFNGQFFAGPDRDNPRYDQVYALIDDLRNAPGDGPLAFHWASNNFSITHQKTILIDASADGTALPADQLPPTARALVLTMNLCPYAWMTADEGEMKGSQFPLPWQFWGPDNPQLTGFPLRDFGALLSDPTLVATIASVFQSDFDGAPGNQTNDLKESANGLVWSNGTTGLPGYYPNGGSYPVFDADQLGGAVDEGNARATHLQLIAAAQHTLIIYNEEMNDSGIVTALIAAAQRGVQIRALLTGNIHGSGSDVYYQYADNYTALTQAGATIRLFPAGPGHMYIHAKALVADAGSSDTLAFMGSENISGNSLNFNRELGVQLQGEADTQLIVDTFEEDWGTDGLLQWPDDGSTPTPPPPADDLPVFNPTQFSTVPMREGLIEPR